MVALEQWHSAEPASSVESRDATSCLQAFAPIALEEIGDESLQDRIDTKFVFSTAELKDVLTALSSDYRVLDIGGTRLHGYQTLYFDTRDAAMYHAQHAGRPHRYKVRARRYAETDASFLEVKHKDPKSRTIKSRVATESFLTTVDLDAAAFIDDHVPFSADGLVPRLWNWFSRITLVGRGTPERLTLDLDLAFDDGETQRAFPGVVIAELKQSGVNRDSAFLHQMRQRHIHASSFSKYCIGTAALKSDLKHNRFKPALLHLTSLSERCAS